MTRPRKATVDYFPNKRQMMTAIEIGGDFLKRYLRNSSSAYIKKGAVRESVFRRDNHRCVFCGSIEQLQVDHIFPVHRSTPENIYFVNSLSNLRTLCRICNGRRCPDE